MITNDKTILVTGGAGYIGSFMVRNLHEKGYKVIVVDDLSRSESRDLSRSESRDLSRNEVKEFPENVDFHNINIGDKDKVSEILKNNSIDGVIHFAGFISMGESMKNPYIYFKNNTFKSLKLLEVLKDNNIKNIVFSSTAGVYGNPQQVPIPEDSAKSPTNPYGESKLMFEKILDWYQKIFGISYASLRYFNACGASLDGKLGESHEPETHIIPRAMQSILKNSQFELYGTDYDTPDGTCVRDYIHVLDLVEAHELALEKIIKDPGGYNYNVGTGKGYSNREIIDVIEKVTGKELNVLEKDRRQGDANELVADVSKIGSDLGFSPKHSDLPTIIESSWKWHSKQ